MQLCDCDESHGAAILAILNEAIVNSTAIYDYKPRTLESMSPWFESKKVANFPVIGAFSNAGGMLGFATYGSFRRWPAYKYSVEHSLYVAPACQGQGIGKSLLSALIERARQQGYHAMIGGIDSTNAASIALHERFGFKHAATLPEVGFKFGRWLDLCFYQLLLDTPANPKDG